MFICVYVCRSAGAYKNQRAAADSLVLEMQVGLTAYHGHFEPNSGPLKEQQVMFSAAQSLQPLPLFS